jgi:SPP1 family predicted phage head-tail adaptor
MSYPGRKFKTADMFHRIVVEAPTSSFDDRGQSIKTWTTWLSSEPASFNEVSGGETLNGRQVEAGVTAVFRVNYRDGYTNEHRIRFQGVIYGITRVHPVGGFDRYRDIYCKAVK